MLRTIQKSKLVGSINKYAFQKRTLASINHNLNDAYDVVIIGGGVAGATLACSLGKTKLSKKKKKKDSIN
jgi:ubiquinone biosynthesis monooxygenase Coq6